MANKRSAPVLQKASDGDRIIVIMGPTGAGKSTFINIATGQDGQTIGHGMESHTATIRAVRVRHPSMNEFVVFVDTPGFDDTYKPDVEILRMIADWLVKTHKGKVKLTTIVYLHRITDNRLSGSLLKNLRMFTSLCGQEAMPNVVIGTTMWGEVRQEHAERRETEMKRTFWADMLKNGCRVERFLDTYESAWHLVDKVSEDVSTKVQVSHEIVDFRKLLQQTAAGITLNEELQRLIKARKEASRQLRAQMNKEDNGIILQELNKQQAEIDEQIVLTANQLRELKIPMKNSFMKFLSRILNK